MRLAVIFAGLSLCPASMFAQGRGPAIMAHNAANDGKTFDKHDLSGIWTRNGTKGGTHYRDSVGHDIPLKPGSTWVLLLPNTRSAVLS